MYKCAMCGETYEEDWTEEEAIEELNNNFPGFDKADCEVVCDDCYKEFMEKGKMATDKKMKTKLYLRIRPTYRMPGSWAFVIGFEGGQSRAGGYFYGDRYTATLWAFGICLGFWVLEFGKRGEI